MSGGRVGLAAGLTGAFVAALALRALGFERVFPGEGNVVFDVADAQYHLRRAWWTLQSFPHVPAFDLYVNHPHGAWIPWPPLWDALLAAGALALGGSREAFERLAAWAPVLVGSLTVLPVQRLGARVAGEGVGLGAAWIYALLPVPVLYAAVGNPDHHAAVGLAGAVLLLLYVSALDPPRTRGALLRLQLALLAARLATLLLWHGSLLYLAIGELALVLHGSWRDRRDALAAQAASCAATALCVAPFALDAGSAVGGRFSAVELSGLHVLAYAAAAGVALGAAALGRGERGGPVTRLVRLAALLALAGGLVLALPGVRGGLGSAWTWLAQGDDFGARVLEQRAVWSSLDFALERWGLAAFAIPLVPLAFALRARRRAEPAPLLLLAVWTLVTGYLALSQLRYGNDFAAAGSVGLALLAAAAGRALAGALPGAAGFARPIAALLVAAALAPGLWLRFAPALGAGVSHLTSPRSAGDPLLGSFEGTLARFAAQVRDATPATSGLYDAGVPPEYAILTLPALGHVLHYGAERATPADNFGPYAGPANYQLASHWFLMRNEARAAARLAGVRARYVVTAALPGRAPATMGARLHDADGAAVGPVPHLEHFRLVTEGPPGGGVPLAWAFQLPLAPGFVAYKLFERVPGARLQVEAAPGQELTIRLALRTPARRRVVWQARARAGPDGIAELRVPYATQDAEAPVQALGPYQIEGSGPRRIRHVSEAEVQGDARVRVGSGRR